MIDIVFNVNPLGLEGLGATLSSLIRNCSNPKELKIWFLCSDFRDKDQINIEQLLISEGFDGITKFIFFDAKKVFGYLKPLHGDWTAYGRLLISNYIDNDIALYLDSDLIIMLDVLTLKGFNFQGCFLAAVYGSTVAFALENAFFINTLQTSPDQGYFNSGIILFDLKRWREESIDAKWMSFSKQYPTEMLAADQTILNAICDGKFAYLPSHFNNPWYPGSNEPSNANTSIIHFVGSPKPWDILGGFIHKGYDTWNSYTTSSWKKEYGSISQEKLKRTWKIRKSIAKHLKNIFLK